MKANQKGFGVVEVLIIVVVAGLLGAVGWFVYDRQKDKTSETSNTQTSTEQEDPNNIKVIGNVTFKPASQFSETEIKEITSKVTDLFNYYHTSILNTPVESITITLSRDEVYAYVLDYEDGSSLFGSRDEPIKYWYPDSDCDEYNDSSCKKYHEEFNKKFPESYKQFQVNNRWQ